MAKKTKTKHLLFAEHFTRGIKDPEKMFPWSRRDCLIRNRNGGVFFSMKDVEAPQAWSQLAVDIAASKYFRRKVKGGFKGEHSIRQMVERVAAAITKAGLSQGGVFASKSQAEIFKKELKYILYSQRGAFNSPVWFNVGLDSYGVSSKSEHWAWSDKARAIQRVDDAYQRPQCSACFIQGVEDSLESIFDLAKVEAKLFKYGSGSGTNFSNLRSKHEALQSGGGNSSGLLSFLEVLDRGAGAIKSGGTTRRAAKMVCVDIDHPEILDFIDWKRREELKAHALIAAGYSPDFEGEAYRTVSGQNANNSVRVTNAFMKTYLTQGVWQLRSRVDGTTIQTLPAQEIWDRIVHSAWTCADPGVQFHDTINDWHTCPQAGEIRSSNPCSEYMFIDDSACNLASINLAKFISESGEFDLVGFMHVARVLFVAQEILVDYSSYPTAKIAHNSHWYRPLGLGFANLGSFLMRQGIPYDSEVARTWAGAISSLMLGIAYWTSSQLANTRGAFKGYRKNKKDMLHVLKRHRTALNSIHWPLVPDSFKTTCYELWEDVLAQGMKYGFRNAQATVIAPTGTIGLLMDCDTTGIEPDYSLIKYKKLAGGGEVEIINQSVEMALRKLNYPEGQILPILEYIKEHRTLEGSSQLKSEHLPVFDCATAASGGRVLSAQSHLLMLAAVQPFVSGAISKTVNIPASASEEEVSQIYLQSWRLGLKAISIYRDGSKISQPLNLKKKPNPQAASNLASGMKCPECGNDTVLTSGCYRCPNCGSTVGCA